MNKKTKKPNASIIEIAKCDEEENNTMKPKSWSIIKAMDKLLDLARDSELSDQFWKTSKKYGEPKPPVIIYFSISSCFLIADHSVRRIKRKYRIAGIVCF